jgi:site-specific DNA-methyltransferase (adenine-specific)
MAFAVPISYATPLLANIPDFDFSAIGKVRKEGKKGKGTSDPVPDMARTAVRIETIRMSETPAASSQSVATPPPAETLRGGRFSWFAADNMTTQGLVWLLRECAVQWARLLVDGGSAIVFCDWRMFPILAPALESSGLRYQNLLVWDKGSMGLGRGFRMQHELAIHLTNGVGKYYAADVGNVIQCRRVREDEREHATQKPVDLLARMVSTVAPPDGLVIDPFCGSGSVGVACAATGRRFAGWELSDENAEIARRRIAGEPRTGVAQVPMFGAAS